jgi:formate hydrogenlyase subunit 4
MTSKNLFFYIYHFLLKKVIWKGNRVWQKYSNTDVYIETPSLCVATIWFIIIILSGIRRSQPIAGVTNRMYVTFLESGLFYIITSINPIEISADNDWWRLGIMEQTTLSLLTWPIIVVGVWMVWISLFSLMYCIDFHPPTVYWTSE